MVSEEAPDASSLQMPVHAVIEPIPVHLTVKEIDVAESPCGGAVFVHPCSGMGPVPPEDVAYVPLNEPVDGSNLSITIVELIWFAHVPIMFPQLARAALGLDGAAAVFAGAVSLA